MNKKQRRLLIGVAAVVFMMLLYPPYHYYPQSITGSSPYYWIFTTHMGDYGKVNIGLLITQWIGVLIIGCLCYFLLEDRNKT